MAGEWWVQRYSCVRLSILFAHFSRTQPHTWHQQSRPGASAMPSTKRPTQKGFRPLLGWKRRSNSKAPSQAAPLGVRRPHRPLSEAPAVSHTAPQSPAGVGGRAQAGEEPRTRSGANWKPLPGQLRGSWAAPRRAELSFVSKDRAGMLEKKKTFWTRQSRQRRSQA